MWMEPSRILNVCRHDVHATLYYCTGVDLEKTVAALEQ